MLYEFIFFHIIAYLARLKERVGIPAGDNTAPVNPGMPNHLLEMIHEVSDIFIIDTAASTTQNPEVSLEMILCKKLNKVFFTSGLHYLGVKDLHFNVYNVYSLQSSFHICRVCVYFTFYCYICEFLTSFTFIVCDILTHPIYNHIVKS